MYSLYIYARDTQAESIPDRDTRHTSTETQNSITGTAGPLEATIKIFLSTIGSLAAPSHLNTNNFISR